MFQINQLYSKRDIYAQLKVPADVQNWNTGYHEYKGMFYIFANIGVAGRTGHDYNNAWEKKDKLKWYGKTNSHLNQPSVKRLLDPATVVNIFTRENDRAPFTYKGIGVATNIQDTSPIQVTWVLNTNIPPQLAWPTFLSFAVELMSAGESLFYGQKEYKIVEANSRWVTIRTNGQPDVKLTYELYTAAIKSIATTGKLALSGSAHKKSAIETAIVQTLPALDYSENKKIIMEATDDKDLVSITRQLRVRRGQNKLRNNLLHLYYGKCCISGFHIGDALHACHIFLHSKTGNNHSTNALLLRSDLHDLFDAHLIGINPSTLKVHIHRSLKNTEYAQLEGRLLSKRKDDETPNRTALKERWKLFKR